MKTRGVITIELVVAITLLLTIGAAMAAVVHSIGTQNRLVWLRQTCLNAGQAQMEHLSLTGQLIPEEKFNRLWPNIRCTIHKSPGSGDWQGLVRVELTAVGQIRHRQVAVSLCRYILPPSEAHND